MPNDAYLNEACEKALQGIKPRDQRHQNSGSWNGSTHKQSAQFDAGFCRHFHRSVDHKRLERTDRSDVLKIIFARLEKDSEDEIVEEVRHWTAKEFKTLKINDNTICSRLLDKEAEKEVSGLYKVKSIDEENVVNLSAKDLVATVERKYRAKVKKSPGKQIEIYVVHDNIIRWIFLRLMQFDESRWFGLSGSNCTMTQLRIKPTGSVICDFFAAHESKMPVSHYTSNNHKDV